MPKMAKDRPARRKPDHATNPGTAVEPLDAQWLPAIDRRLFWLLAMIPILVFVGMSAQGLTRPFEGLHSWAQADSAWFTRNHIRYGLGYTHGVMTMAMGNPPPENPKRYYDHPQYGGMLSAGVMWLFGVNEWSLRLGMLIVDLAVLLLLMAILRRFMGAWPALLTGLLLAMFPISAYFGLGSWLTMFGLGAFWMYLMASGQVPDKQARWWHYVALGTLLFVCVQISWSGFFFAAAIGIHYVLACIIRRRWPQWGLLAVMVVAPLASAVMVFTVMLSGFDWDYHRIIDLYKWRAAGGEMAGQGGFKWVEWFKRAGEFGLSNFTLPVLLAAGGYLVYLGAAQLYRFICRLTGLTAGAVAQPFPLGLLFLLPGLLQMFILRGTLGPHQYWERPLGPFIAIAAALGILVIGRSLRQVHRAVAVAVMAGAVVLCGWASVEGANYYYSIVWHTPKKIAMWKELNRLIPPDKELITFDRELDSLVVTENKAKGPVYRGEPTWYIDRIIVDANTPEQVEALRKSKKVPVYLLPWPGSLGYGKYGTDAQKVYEKHVRVAEYLVKRYPVISQYPGVDSVPDPERPRSILKFGMRPYLIFDLTKPGRPNFQPQAGRGCESLRARGAALLALVGVRAAQPVADDIRRTALALVVRPDHDLRQQAHQDKLDRRHHQQDREGHQDVAVQVELFAKDPLANHHNHEDESQHHRNQPQSAEDVDRLGRVGAQEPHRHKVQHDLDRPVEPVLGHPRRPRPVVHDHFGDPGALPVGQGGDEAVHLAVELRLGHDLAAVGLEAAPVVVQADAGHSSDQPVGDPRGQLAGGGLVLAVLPPAADDVVALVQLVHHPWNVGRVVLKVGVQRDHHVAASEVETGAHRRGLAEVAAETDDLHTPVGLVALAEKLVSAVGAAIVDENDLEVVLARQRFGDLLVKLRKVCLFIEKRNHDRQLRAFLAWLGIHARSVLPRESFVNSLPSLRGRRKTWPSDPYNTYKWTMNHDAEHIL